MFTIPENVLYILNKIEESGFEAYIVGGCVRDFLLLNKAKDWDITTNALPIDIKNIFEHTVDTGIQHGTVTVVLNGNNYEITTYRIDGEYKNYRKPEEVIFTKNIVKDLSRRDFTMNAIAYNPNGTFVDPFEGKKDIENKIIRGVGVANVRFNEDALRMMRGVRFVTQLNFKLEKSTFDAIKNNAHLIKNISIERVRDEFIKMLKSEYIENINLLNSTNLLKYFLPEIESKLSKNFNKTVIILKNIKDNYILRLAYLLEHLDLKNSINILKRLKLDNSTINKIKIILENINFIPNDNISQTRFLMSRIEPNILKSIITLKFILYRFDKDLINCKTLDNIYDQIDIIIKQNQCYNLKNLCINGNDIKKIGITNGKIIGQILNHCLKLVLSNQNYNNKDFLISEAMKFLN